MPSECLTIISSLCWILLDTLEILDWPGQLKACWIELAVGDFMLLSKSKRGRIVWVGSCPISVAYLHTFTAFIVFTAPNAPPLPRAWNIILILLSYSGLPAQRSCNRNIFPEKWPDQKGKCGWKRGNGISFKRKRVAVADFVDYGELEHWSMEGSGIKEIEEI